MAAQEAQGAIAQRFGELITGAILVREAMAPTLRVQGILKGKRGKGSLVADSHPDGTSRGLVNFGNAGGELLLGDGALLQMMRTLPSGTIHQGVVEVPGAASSRAAACLPRAHGLHAGLRAGRLHHRGRPRCSTAIASSPRAATSSSSCPRSSAAR